MFATKPSGASEELLELESAFGRPNLARALGRHPDTIGRWHRHGDVPLGAQEVVDRFWYVMHVACTQVRWPTRRASHFVLSIEPTLGRRPFELIRDSDQAAGTVVAIMKDRHGWSDESGGDEVAPVAGDEESMMPAPSDPFASMLSPRPKTARDLFGFDPIPVDLTGRTRPIGGKDPDPFRLHLTAADSYVMVAATSLEE